MREAFPSTKILRSFIMAKNIVKYLDLDCGKMHACSKNCMLFWDEKKNATTCSTYGATRWKVNRSFQVKDDIDSSKKAHHVFAKVLQYFPLKPRL